MIVEAGKSKICRAVGPADWKLRQVFVFVVFLALPQGWWDFSSPPTRERTQATVVKAPSPDRWTAREFPLF